jgi:hypothetical protein
MKTRSPIDARHDAFVAEIEEFAASCGCSFQGNPAYHDRLPDDDASRLKFDFSASGLAERLRCDKRMMNPRTGSHIPVEAKTSFRDSGPAIFLFEAYQIGLHRGMRDGCLYAIRKVCGAEHRECGFLVDSGFDPQCIREIRIPDILWRNGRQVRRSRGECEDSDHFYRTAFSEWFPGVRVSRTNTETVCRGSGDPYLILRDEYTSSLRDWRDLVRDFASQVIDSIPTKDRTKVRLRDPSRPSSRQTTFVFDR